MPDAPVNGPEITTGPIQKEAAVNPVFDNSVIRTRIARQEPKFYYKGIPVAAFTDIDGTLASKRPGTRSATAEIAQLLENDNIPLIAVTGRDLPGVLKGIAGEDSNYPGLNLPQFDIIATAVGTEIYLRQPDGSYLPDPQYEELIKTKGWNREAIYQHVCLPLIDEGKSLNLRFQERDKPENVDKYSAQSATSLVDVARLDLNQAPQPYKISFNFDGAPQDVDNVRDLFTQKLAQLGLEEIKVVISFDKNLENGQIGYNVDLVPVTKADVINYMCEQYGLSGIVAGDSGNDADMLMQSANAGVIVGGAKRELTDVVTANSEDRQTRHFRVINNNRLLFIDPASDRFGPQSLIKARRAFRLLQALSRT